MASPQIDDSQLRSLVAEGLSPTEIAKRLGLPRSTVRERLQKLDLAPPPGIPAAVSTDGIPHVYNAMLLTMIPALQEMVTWWQEHKATLDAALGWQQHKDTLDMRVWWEERKALLEKASDASQDTERTTFHVERRWVEAIRRQADLDHLTITQVVNRAFQTFFTEKSP